MADLWDHTRVRWGYEGTVRLRLMVSGPGEPPRSVPGDETCDHPRCQGTRNDGEQCRGAAMHIADGYGVCSGHDMRGG